MDEETLRRGQAVFDDLKAKAEKGRRDNNAFNDNIILIAEDLVMGILSEKYELGIAGAERVAEIPNNTFRAPRMYP